MFVVHNDTKTEYAHQRFQGLDRQAEGPATVTLASCALLLLELLLFLLPPPRLLLLLLLLLLPTIFSLNIRKNRNRTKNQHGRCPWWLSRWSACLSAHALKKRHSNCPTHTWTRTGTQIRKCVGRNVFYPDLQGRLKKK